MSSDTHRFKLDYSAQLLYADGEPSPTEMTSGNKDMCVLDKLISGVSTLELKIKKWHPSY